MMERNMMDPVWINGPDDDPDGYDRYLNSLMEKYMFEIPKAVTPEQIAGRREYEKLPGFTVAVFELNKELSSKFIGIGTVRVPTARLGPTPETKQKVADHFESAGWIVTLVAEFGVEYYEFESASGII